MIKPHLIMTIFACIVLSLTLTTTTRSDEPSNQGVRDVQQVLKDCGFNPGQIDGIWGNQTTTAAKSFLQAHGELSTSENTVILMTQVDSYRIGDDGPCPDKVADIIEQIQEEVGEPGKPVDAAVDVADQAREGEAKDKETELIAEVKRTMERSANWETSGDIPILIKTEIKILDDRIRYLISDDKSADPMNYKNPVETLSYEIKFIDIGAVSANFDRDVGGPRLDISCREKDENSLYHCNSFTWHEVHDTVFRDEYQGVSISPGYEQIWANPYYEQTARNNIKAAATALENLIAYYDNNSKQSTGQPPAKCYEWVSLGEFNIGKWINGYGRETSGLQVGSDRKFYDRDELETHYKDYHSNCQSSAESARDNAINAMILVGRHTDDIEDERRRIRAFYQDNLDKCQAHFKQLWEKYEGKFCE